MKYISILCFLLSISFNAEAQLFDSLKALGDKLKSTLNKSKNDKPESESPDVIPLCPQVDFSKKLHIGPDGRTGKWNNCFGKYIAELNDSFKGNIYEGNFQKGFPNGQGSLTQPNGDQYIGNFKDGSFSGQGLLIFANGDKYEGEFKDHKQHGQGTLIYSDGQPSKEGIWADGKFIKSEKITLLQNQYSTDAVVIEEHRKLLSKQKNTTTQELSQSTKEIEVSVGVVLVDTAVFTVKNNSYAPQIFKITASTSPGNEFIGENRLIIGPRSQTDFAMSAKAGRDFSGKWIYNFNFDVGDPQRKLVEYQYKFPFEKNTTVTVCQSKDGVITSHIDYPEAIDFCAPLKTPILAARDGIVASIVQVNSECGMDSSCFEKSNFIKIFHSDGSVALYNHIYKNSVKVKLGQKVNVGDPLAEVGATGQVSGPHLHFEVTKSDAYLTKIYTETKFFRDSGEELKIKYLENISIKDQDAISTPINSVEYFYENSYFGKTTLNGNKKETSWFENHEKKSVTREYEKIGEDERYLLLKLKDKDLRILLPKMGGMSFISTDEGSNFFPQSKVRLSNQLDKNEPLNTDFLESFSYRTGSIRKYLINKKNYWVESSFGMLSTFFFYEEQKTDAQGVHILDKKNNRYFVISKAKGIIFSSSDNGKTLRLYQNVIENKEKLNSTLLDVKLASKPCDDMKGDALEKANSCYLVNDFNKVKDILSAYIATSKNNGRAYAMLGKALTSLEMHSDAVKMFELAVTKNWISYDSSAYHARSLDALGRIDESIKWNKKALNLAPQLIDVTKMLAEQLDKVGKTSEAINVLVNFDKKRLADGKDELFESQITNLKNKIGVR